MRIVLRNADNFCLLCNRLMDISGSHTNRWSLPGSRQHYRRVSRANFTALLGCHCYHENIHSLKDPPSLKNKIRSVFTHIKSVFTSKAKIEWRMCSVRYVARHTADITCAAHFVMFGATSTPLPFTSGCSVRYEHINSGTGHVGMFITTSVHIGKFDTKWIRVSYTAVNSVH